MSDKRLSGFLHEWLSRKSFVKERVLVKDGERGNGATEWNENKISCGNKKKKINVHYNHIFS